ncbi:MAG: electron transfer flavoprotein subunit beta/FixA family protein [Chloroflexi bacterium]|nr:electron transfer flavoprotein subunit beta/FixA family protein [Chloroflexota bacterium]
MRIVVLVKPVPDATGQERLGPDGRLDRSAAPPVLNGNDEYTLEAALRLADSQGAEVTLLAMGPAGSQDALRKGLAMGAARAVLVTDLALAGSCALSTMEVLAAALRAIPFDLVLAGADSADGGGGVVGAGIATLLDLPLVSGAAAIDAAGEAAVRVRRIAGGGEETVEVPLPAVVVGTQLLGEPRYPTLKGIMGARAKEMAVRSLADLGLAPGDVGGAAATTVVLAQRPPAARAAARVVREAPDAAAREIVDLLIARGAI